MIKKITFIFFALVFAAALTSSITNGSGAPYKTTGSPGDGKDCSMCHSGSTATANFITTDIPASGYISGQTYTITLTATKSGINKFGFELTAEDAAHAKKGAFAITNTAETKMVMDEVTHTGNGTSGTNGSKTWTAQWTAPPAGTGAVTFYSAVNAANGDGGTGGDQTILSNLTVQEDPSNAIGSASGKKSLKVYPSVVSSQLSVEAGDDIFRLYVSDMSGKIVLDKNLPASTRNIKLNLGTFSKGLYLLSVETKSGKAVKKFMKK